MSLANDAVIADQFLLPTLEELTAGYAKATYFSKLDLKWGHLQVKHTPRRSRLDWYDNASRTLPVDADAVRFE